MSSYDYLSSRLNFLHSVLSKLAPEFPRRRPRQFVTRIKKGLSRTKTLDDYYDREEDTFTFFLNNPEYVGLGLLHLDLEKYDSQELCEFICINTAIVSPLFSDSSVTLIADKYGFNISSPVASLSGGIVDTVLGEIQFQRLPLKKDNFQEHFSKAIAAYRNTWLDGFSLEFEGSLSEFTQWLVAQSENAESPYSQWLSGVLRKFQDQQRGLIEIMEIDNSWLPRLRGEEPGMVVKDPRESVFVPSTLHLEAVLATLASSVIYKMNSRSTKKVIIPCIRCSRWILTKPSSPYCDDCRKSFDNLLNPLAAQYLNYRSRLGAKNLKPSSFDTWKAKHRRKFDEPSNLLRLRFERGSLVESKRILEADPAHRHFHVPVTAP